MKEILRLIVPTIRSLGFKGSGQTYYRVSEQITCIINFQKSRGGNIFYVNIGVQPNCLLENMEPKKLKEHDCMFRDRLDPPSGLFGWPYELKPVNIELLISQLEISQDEYFGVLDSIKQKIIETNVKDIF